MRVRLAFGWPLGLPALGRATVLACTCIWAGPFLTVGAEQDLFFAVRTNANTAAGGYEISSCGEFAIKVAKETVSGRLSGEARNPGPVETMSLKELRSRLQRSGR